MSLELSGKPDAWKLARPVWGWGRGEIPGLHHEIRSCCRLAALLDVTLVEAAQNVVPIARTAAESVDRLRQWASGRCLDADKPGIYQCSGKSVGAKRRRVSTAPSNN